MPIIEILVGMIASGKSTYAVRRADEGALVVSHDDLTEMLHARDRHEQGLRECYRLMEEAIAMNALLVGRDVVIDGDHLTRASRLRWLIFSRNLSLPDDVGCEYGMPMIVAVAFHIAPAKVHAKRRYEYDPRGRSREDWLRVAEHHAACAAAEPLSEDEGFDEIIRVEGDIYV